MRLKELLEIDARELLNLPEEQLRRVSKSIIDAANKRIKRLANDPRGGRYSPALKSVERGKKIVPLKRGGKYNTMRSETAKALRFLKHESSTIRGFRDIQKETARRLESDIPYNTDLAREFWQGYRIVLEENYTAVKDVWGSENVQRYMANEMEEKGRSQRDTINKVEKLLQASYEKAERKRAQERQASGKKRKYWHGV